MRQCSGPGPTSVPTVSNVIIRKATAEDWAGIYPFFSAIVATGTMYAHPESLSLEAARPQWMEQSPGRTGGGRRGRHHPGLGQDGPEPCQPRFARGHRQLHVDPPQAGRGVGRALGEHVLVWARSAGYRSMQFNAVVETNTGAVHLWQSFGFQILTTIPEAFDHHEHGLVGLHIIFQTLTEREDADNAL